MGGMNSKDKSFGTNIIPQNALGGMINITKEDTLPRIWLEFRFATAGRANPNTGTKIAKVFEIISFTSSLEQRRSIMSFHSKSILDSEMVIKGIRPKFRIQIRAEKKSAYRIPNGKMGTFD